MIVGEPDKWISMSNRQRGTTLDFLSYFILLEIVCLTIDKNRYSSTLLIPMFETISKIWFERNKVVFWCNHFFAPNTLFWRPTASELSALLAKVTKPRIWRHIEVDHDLVCFFYELFTNQGSRATWHVSWIASSFLPLLGSWLAPLGAFVPCVLLVDFCFGLLWGAMRSLMVVTYFFSRGLYFTCPSFLWRPCAALYLKDFFVKFYIPFWIPIFLKYSHLFLIAILEGVR